MMSRPDLCPNCGASTTAHTGSYCQECGEPLVQRPKRNARSEAIAEVELAINSALLVFPVGAVLAEEGGEQAAAIRKALLDARGNIREAMGEART